VGKASPAVSVVVVAYNSGDYLQACIDSLAAQTLTDFECLIADNASTDGSVARLELPDARFRVLAMGENLGFAAANNRAAAKARAPYLVLLNPDAVAEPDFLAALTAKAETTPAAAAIGAVQLRLETPDILDGVGDCWHVAGVGWRALEGFPAASAPGDGAIFAPCGAAALYRRDVFLALGGFDERFFCYAEDVDLGFRLRLAGWTCERASSARVRHAGSAITGRASDFTLYHGHRNRIWTFLKNTPQELFPLAVPYHLAVNLYLLVFGLARGAAPSLWRAYCDAWRGRQAFLEERRRRPPRLGPALAARDFYWTPVMPRRRKPKV
jgi:GT2 family glycosyltransferase